MLFSAAATAGALTAGGSADDIAALTAYAKNLGLAFQIVDDLLDVTGTPAETGKVTRARRAQDDVRLVQRRGRRARARRPSCARPPITALAPFGRRAARLNELAEFVADRRF